MDDDNNDVVLVRYTVDHHANDTDDIAIEFAPETYDKKHSKRWNMLVDK